MHSIMIRVFPLLLLFSSTSLYAVEEPVIKFLTAARDKNLALAKQAIAEGVGPHYILGRGQVIDNNLIMRMMPGTTEMAKDVKLISFAKNCPEILKLFFDQKLKAKDAAPLLNSLYRMHEFDFLEDVIRSKKVGKFVISEAVYIFTQTLPQNFQDSRTKRHLAFLSKHGFYVQTDSESTDNQLPPPNATLKPAEAGTRDKVDDKTGLETSIAATTEASRKAFETQLIQLKKEGRDINLMLGFRGRPRAVHYALDFRNSVDSRDALILMARHGVDLNMSIRSNDLNKTIGSFIMEYVRTNPEYLDELITAEIKFDFIVTHLKGQYADKVEHVMAFILRVLGVEAFEKVVEAGNSPVIKLPEFTDEMTLKQQRGEEVARAYKLKAGIADEAIRYYTAIQKSNSVFEDPAYLKGVVEQFKAEPAFLIKHGVNFEKSILRDAVMEGRLNYATKLVRVGANIDYFCKPPQFENSEDFHHFMSVRERILSGVSAQKHPGYPRLLMHAIANDNIEFTRAVFQVGLNWSTKLSIGDKKVSALRYAMEQESFNVINTFEILDEHLIQKDAKHYLLLQLQIGNQAFMPFRQRLVDAIY